MLKLRRDETPPDGEDFKQFNELIQEVLEVRARENLTGWLNGRLQQYIPHDVLIAAWGNFQQGSIHLEMFTSLPDDLSAMMSPGDVKPLLVSLYKRWTSDDRRPFSLNVQKGEFEAAAGAQSKKTEFSLKDMVAVIVHGISDQRGQNDYLYAFFSKYPKQRRNEAYPLKVLLPYIDAAFRQVKSAAVPVQADYKDTDFYATTISAGLQSELLTEREIEIMKWVATGKTDEEVGNILNVSAFTIKRHMQRIFRNLDVFTRAQAIATFKDKFDFPAGI